MTKLSIAMHYGNFMHDVLGNAEEAVVVCEKVVSECMANLDSIEEERFAETSNLCELLKENI